MYIEICVTGLNLERFLRVSAQNGIVLFRIRRIDAARMRVCVFFKYYSQLTKICSSGGWDMCVLHTGWLIRAFRFINRRRILPISFLGCVFLVWLSAGMVLKIHVTGARENGAEVRRFLAAAGVKPGIFKDAYPIDALREEMALYLPGLAFSGIRYEGSVMNVECFPSIEKEIAGVNGKAADIVALEPGIVTRIAAVRGTPAVEPGDVVAKGQILIRGEERGSGGIMPVHAQGTVDARVWAKGNARISLREKRIVETGQTSRGVTVRSPWHERVLSSARPFSSQQIFVERQMVIGLYLPLWREISTASETIVFEEQVKPEDAASRAQAAAERIARQQCPHGVSILNKTVSCRQSDSHVQAEVILEYEKQIAGRLNQ